MVKLIAPERILETSRLLLEPLIPDHASAIYEQLLDQRLYQFIPQSPPTSLQTVKTRYLALSSRLSPDGQEGWLNWVIRFRESGVYVGTLQATVHANCTAAMFFYIITRLSVAFDLLCCAHLCMHLAPLRVALGNQGQLPPRSMLEHRRRGVHVLQSQSLRVPP